MPYKARLQVYLFISVGLLTVFGLLSLRINSNYSTNKSFAQSNSKPAVLGASTLSTHSWQQTSFTGGINQGPYVIPWDSIGGWSNYSSATNATIDSTGVRSANGSSGELISSIFDQGTDTTRRAAIVAEWVNDGSDTHDPPTIDALVSWRGADSSAGIANASWSVESPIGGVLCTLPYRFIQYKLVLPVAVSSYQLNAIISSVKVLTTWPPLEVTGVVTDAATGTRIASANISANGVTTTSSTEHAINQYGTELAGIYGLYTTYVNPISVTVSATGYTSQTKSYPVTTLGTDCYQVISGDFALNQSSSSGSGATVPKKTNSTTTPNGTTSTTTNNQIKLPQIFTQTGSTTTDFSKISDLTKVPGLTFDVIGKNKIIYQEPVDLSSQAAQTELSKLDQYVKLESSGVVVVDSKDAPFLNKKATILMYSLPFTSTPKVLVDGKENSQVVSGILYSQGIVSFNVAHFTKFETVANTSKSLTTSSKSSSSLLISLSLIFIACSVLGGGSYIYYKKKKKTKV